MERRKGCECYEFVAMGPSGCFLKLMTAQGRWGHPGLGPSGGKQRLETLVVVVVVRRMMMSVVALR